MEAVKCIWLAKQSMSNSEFNLKLNKTKVKEGGAFKAMLSSSTKYGSRPIYWLLSGYNFTPADLKNGQISGTGTLKKDGSLKNTFELNADCTKEGTETLRVSYFTDAELSNIVAEQSIKVIDKSNSPDNCDSDTSDNTPYLIEPSRIQVKENVAIKFKIKNGVADTIIYFDAKGNGVDKNDFDLSYARMSGKAKIGKDGTADITFLARNDNKTEGDENLTVTIYKDKKKTKILGFASVPIIDTSIETAAQGPTKSETPEEPQPIWSNNEGEGNWFSLSPSRTDIRENTSTRTRIDSDAGAGTRLNFSVSGEGIDENDLDLAYARMSGEVELNINGTAFIPHLLRNDNNTEGLEELTLTLFRQGTNKPLAMTTIPVIDTSVETPDHKPTLSPTPNQSQPIWGGGTADGKGSWFTVSPSRDIFEEGETVNTRIDSDADPGETVYWELSGEGISEQDFEQSSESDGLSGTKDIKLNGLAQLKHILSTDNQAEGDENLTITLYRDSSKGTELAKTTFTILDGSAKIEANKIAINEGKSMKFKVFTDGFPVGSDIYWEIEGFNITEGDFETRPITGIKILDETKKFQINCETRKDFLTEGSEFYRLNIYSDSERESLIGSSEAIEIFDTSTTPIQSYELISSTSQVNEGKGFKVKIKTKNVSPGTTLYWEGTGTATDFDVITSASGGNDLSGSTVLDSEGKSVLAFDTVKDKLTEGNETFTVTAYNEPNLINQVGNDVTVEIIDTSTTPIQSYELISSTSQVNEGKGFKVKIKTKNVSPGTTLYWEGTGTATDFDVITSVSGGYDLSGSTVLDSEGKSVLTFDTIKDKLTEGNETFTVTAYSEPNLINQVGNDVTALIIDTSV